MDDLSGILGVDHLRATGHRHHVVEQQRAQHQENGAVAGFDHAALFQPDHRVMWDRAVMRVELAARCERDRVVAALGVGELDAFTRGEWTGCGHAVQRASRLAVIGGRGCRNPLLGC